MCRSSATTISHDDCEDAANDHINKVGDKVTQFFRDNCPQPNDMIELFEQNRNPAIFEPDGFSINIDQQTNSGRADGGSGCGFMGMDPGFWQGALFGACIVIFFVICCCRCGLLKATIEQTRYCCVECCWPFTKWVGRSCGKACSTSACCRPRGGAGGDIPVAGNDVGIDIEAGAASAPVEDEACFGEDESSSDDEVDEGGPQVLKLAPRLDYRWNGWAYDDDPNGPDDVPDLWDSDRSDRWGSDHWDPNGRPWDADETDEDLPDLDEEILR